MAESLKTKIYFVEGNIGVGKTSVINYLKNKYNNNDEYNFITEPIDRYRSLNLYNTTNTLNVLDEFYNKRLHPFQFQTYISTVLLSHIVQNIKENKINIIERSVFSAIDCFSKNLYDMKLMSLEEFSILLEIKKYFNSFIEKYHVEIIYITADPEICVERIKQRNREEENIITVEYLRSLDECHEDMLLELSKYYRIYIFNNKNESIPVFSERVSARINNK